MTLIARKTRCPHCGRDPAGDAEFLAALDAQPQPKGTRVTGRELNRFSVQGASIYDHLDQADVLIRVDGDWESEADRDQYVNALAARLQAPAPAHPGGTVLCEALEKIVAIKDLGLNAALHAEIDEARQIARDALAAHPKEPQDPRIEAARQLGVIEGQRLALSAQPNQTQVARVTVTDAGWAQLRVFDTVVRGEYGRDGFDILAALASEINSDATPFPTPVAWRYRPGVSWPWVLSDDNYEVSCKRDKGYQVEGLAVAQAPAPVAVMPAGWVDAYTAFQGAFDTPLARRRMDDEFCQDARRRLREFNDAMLAAATQAPAVQDGKRLDYLTGHADGLAWAADLVAMDDPRTGDWLHDDRSDLAKAIRKGPDLPDAIPPELLDAERKDAERWRAMRQNLVSVDWRFQDTDTAVAIFMMHGTDACAGPEGADEIADAAIAAATFDVPVQGSES